MTPFTKVYSIAKVTMTDYKLDRVIRVDYDAFEEYMRSLLVTGMPEFIGSLQSLDYHSEIEDVEGEQKAVWYFDADLTSLEISILADTVVYKWWCREIQDVVAFRPKLSTKEFKQLGIDQNLKQRSEYKDKLKEEIDRKITRYQLENLTKLPFFGGN